MNRLRWTRVVPLLVALAAGCTSTTGEPDAGPPAKKCDVADCAPG